MTNSSTFAITLLCVLALTCILVMVYIRYTLDTHLSNRKSTSVKTLANTDTNLQMTETNSVQKPKNITVMTTTLNQNEDVLHSFVESRSSTHLLPTGPNEPTLIVPYPDVSACPFLQQTNNQPAPVSERIVPMRNRPGSTCPRINLWWSDVCGVTSV